MTDGDQTARRPGDFTGAWDPVMMRRMVTVARPVCKLWFRSEVRPDVPWVVRSRFA